MPAASVPVVSRSVSSWRHEAGLAVGIALAYALYLFSTEYHNLYYDAEEYWQLGHRFVQHGRFGLLNYDDAMRGYAYPLVNFICLAVRKALNWPAVTVVKLLNSVLAGLLFGVVGPRLWQASTGALQLPGLRRRLAWAALGFIFWRDYFNFSLSDFPAVLALGVGLWLVQRPRFGAALLAGAALALAVNIRPIYLASVLPVLGLLWVGRPQLRPTGAARLGALLLGAALVLAPQFLINRQHFGASTPLVLSQSKTLGIHNLYLQKLKWGLLHEKYESSVGRELPTGQLLFLDAEGAAMLRAEGISEIDSPGQYLGLAVRHPLTVAASYARHLFAGLDISHPTLYLKRWAPSRALQLLNYTTWFWAVLVALRRKPTVRESLVLAALLLPCLAVIPMSMEARFLLPLHLLLLALVAFGQGPNWAWPGRRKLLVLAVFGLYLGGCIWLSNRIKQDVEPRFRPYLLAGKQ
ncbi:hypothetical protein MON38_09035 [Hymenobacter sp. DH14]|uniref:Uncharacterized protein n=1 Tax=Hymenobacter cyanobacteriorum TaxID=2926463 RepID=A0A9X1VG77_9BACT|nr:hypothetical protein [Hymenobacter cyanobacteriorum]MCI1187562.1 hypothetical protein [Hymenobacter cyanobacteriorum]